MKNIKKLLRIVMIWNEIDELWTNRLAVTECGRIARNSLKAIVQSSIWNCTIRRRCDMRCQVFSLSITQVTRHPIFFRHFSFYLYLYICMNFSFLRWKSDRQNVCKWYSIIFVAVPINYRPWLHVRSPSPSFLYFCLFLSRSSFILAFGFTVRHTTGF